MTAIHLPPGSPSGQNLDTSSLRAQLSANKLAALMPAASSTGAAVNQSHGAATQAADAAARANPQGHASQSPPGSTRETLSFAARTILTLLGQGQSGPLRTPGPLLPLPPTRMTNGAGQVQQALVSLVQDSGLFYESHLAQWVAGERGLASMAREPQAGIGRDTYPGGAPGGQPRAGQPGQPQGGSHSGGGVGSAASGTGQGTAPAGRAASAPLPAAGLGVADIIDVQPLTAPPAGAMQSAAAVAGSIAALASDDGSDAADGTDKPADANADKASAARSDGTAARGPELPRALQNAAQAYQAAASDAARQASSQSSLHATAELDGGASRPEAASGRTEGAPVIHPETEGVVRQQLELLATNQFRWAGEAWPGTPMQWEISDQPEHDAANAGEQAGEGADRNWSSRLVLELPQLGTIEARLTLTPSGLETRLAVQEERILRMLNNAQDRLRNGLVARGIDLQHFSIRRDSEMEGLR